LVSPLPFQNSRCKSSNFSKTRKRPLLLALKKFTPKGEGVENQH